MASTMHGVTLSRNAIKQRRSEDSKCLQFKMGDGAPQVLSPLGRSPDMENRQLVSQTAKVDHGPIKFIISKVSTLPYFRSFYMCSCGLIARLLSVVLTDVST